MEPDSSTKIPVNQTPKSPISNPAVPAPSGPSTFTPPSPPGPDQTPPSPPKDFKPSKPPKSGKKGFKLVLILLILILAGAAAWYFFIKKDSSNTASAPPPVAQTSQTSTQTFEPVNVAYAFKAKDTDPYITYIRPVTGGDRVAGKTLIVNEPIMGSDVNGQNAIFVTSKSIYVSTDSGKNFTAIYTLATGEQVTSVKLSTNGKTIVFGSLADKATKNKVMTMDLTGKNNKDLFTATKAGVFINAYSTDKNKIIYQEGCWNCDGFDGLPTMLDLASNKQTKLLTNVKATEVGDFSTNLLVSNDFTKLLYIKNTQSANPSDSNLLGGAQVPPYTVNQVDLATLKTTQLATIGKKGETKTYEIHICFIAGSSTPCYSNNKQLFTVKAGKSSLTFESTSNILLVPFVGTDNVIVGTGKDTSDYALSNYTISTKKLVKLFQGDNNTVIFGVTTK